MSYIDAFHDREADRIRVVERVDGLHVETDFPVPYTFYHLSPNGTHFSIFGDRCKRVIEHNGRRFRYKVEEQREKLAAQGHRADRCIFESDINPVFRFLASAYTSPDLPILNIGFFDIEVAFDPARGYAPVENPFAEVTAISLYQSAGSPLVCLALRPKDTFTREAADELEKETPGLAIFEHEADLLDAFLTLIEEVSILSGWNSEQFDVPYLVGRVKRVLGEDALQRFCRFGQKPKERVYEKFGKKFQTYELPGRPHLDYLLLYQKHNTQQQHSYRLDYIGEIETGETKVPYEGTLDTLYRFDFPKFVTYNLQDTALLAKIDAKRKFIDLANQIAHANKVTLKATMGSVALIEQAITNEMHLMGFVVPDRKQRDDEPADEEADNYDEDDDAPFEEQVSGKRFSLRALKDNGRIPVVGAYVAKPVTGLHDDIAACDINSLYPSAIRALNMSPETVFGQVRQDHTKKLIQERIRQGTPRAEAWEGLFSTIEVERMHAQDPDFTVTVDWEDGTYSEMSAAELHQMIFAEDSNLLITANGTIFRTDKEGMIPKLLASWYAERKSLQKKAKEWAAKAKELKETGDEKGVEEALFQSTFFDRAQLAAKIRLNSLYGALLNEACKFYDERLGQSTTLTGRSIVRHMSAKVNEVITGDYDHVGKAIKYGDTDSVYFTIAAMRDDPSYEGFDFTDRAAMVALYDEVAERANASFPDFMQQNFNTGLQRGGIIKAGRELVASKTLFIKKKKYACLIYDLEGARLDVGGKPGKLKVMGLDLKRADTPKFMQEFLQKLLMGILTGVERETMYGWIAEFREAFKARPAWEKGTPRKVNGLTEYGAQMRKANTVSLEERHNGGKVTMPGHVRASLNWNKLCEMHGDRAVSRITDGAKIVVCKLKSGNVLRMDSVAYPIDEPHLPKWFKELPFDGPAMEQTIIDMKIGNLVSVLDWDLSQTKGTQDPTKDLFVFA